MAEGIPEGTGTLEGQAATEPEGTQATRSAAPDSGKGQPEGRQAEGTTKAKAAAPDDDTFFDPRDIQDKPELMAAYKGMQKAFSKKMEAIKQNRAKIEAYDAFAQDPITQLQTMAARMGYRLSRADAERQLEGANQAAQAPKDWQPQTWDEVLQKAEDRAYQRVKKEMDPVLSGMTELRKSNLERYLDDNAPDWRTYEDDMTANLKKHPSLVNDPLTLYRLSVPPEVLESKAVQKALKKMEDKGHAAKVSGASSTTRKPQEGLPDGPISFDDAVRIAKARLAQEGVRPA